MEPPHCAPSGQAASIMKLAGAGLAGTSALAAHAALMSRSSLRIELIGLAALEVAYGMNSRPA